MPPKSGSRFSDKGTRQERRFAEAAGRRGEFWASLYLMLKGYRILARRVKTPVGEIDLIARRLDTTIFVEVKARAFSSGEEDALYAVNRDRILRAAQVWLARHPSAGGIRFDVIFLAPFARPRHITGAFDATGSL
ncbi:MAG: YraN family protein [Devosia sp.]